MYFCTRGFNPWICYVVVSSSGTYGMYILVSTYCGYHIVEGIDRETTARGGRPEDEKSTYLCTICLYIHTKEDPAP